VSEAVSSDPRLHDLIERAFDYRGYVTLQRRDGSELIGYVYDRGPAHVDVLDESATHRTRLSRNEIADIRFTGDDPVKKSQEIWERRKGKLEPRDTPAYGGWAASKPVVLAVALPRELAHVARALGLRPHGRSARGRVGQQEVVAVAIGVGAGALNAILDEEPRLIVSCGFCGGLDPRLRAGDLVLATSVRGAGNGVLQADAPLLSAARRAFAGLRSFEGEVLGATAVAATPLEKRALAKGGALAVDMETWPLAVAAAKAAIPWLSVRAVLDPAGETLPVFAREPRDGYLGPALRHAVSRPRGALQIAHLARLARRAGTSLEEAIRRIADALIAHPGETAGSAEEARP
jgi:adenosylhomocysteine nucleosidase